MNRRHKAIKNKKKATQSRRIVYLEDNNYTDN